MHRLRDVASYQIIMYSFSHWNRTFCLKSIPGAAATLPRYPCVDEACTRVVSDHHRPAAALGGCTPLTLSHSVVDTSARTRVVSREYTLLPAAATLNRSCPAARLVCPAPGFVHTTTPACCMHSTGPLHDRRLAAWGTRWQKLFSRGLGTPHVTNHTIS